MIDATHKRYVCLFAVYVIFGAATAAAQAVPARNPSLRGTVKDPSGAVVPGVQLTLQGAGTNLQSQTSQTGEYSFPSVKPGTYTLRTKARGFPATETPNLKIEVAATLDIELSIGAETQVLTVEGDSLRVNTEPGNNGTALVLGQRELAALSDDPDELLQELQAMAGPGGSPGGGQIYIDGFTGGNMPPKSSIREVRINSNPYAPDYDKPGFGRIEIFTKPGTDALHGSVFAQYNKEALNSRSPLLSQSTRPPYRQQFYGASLSGPIRKEKASFSIDFEHRIISENAFILATTLDSNLNVKQINQAVVTPQNRNSINPRLDYTINAKNTLVFRYQDTRVETDKDGVGDFSLASKAYNQKTSEETVQITETAAIDSRRIDETRFQFLRSHSENSGTDSTPSINVQGAFNGGGQPLNGSHNTTDKWELTNSMSWALGAHSVKFGGRARQSLNHDTSATNFNGTYTFFGGVGPQLDVNNQPVAGTAVQLSALEVYRRTLLFESEGYSPAKIRQLGGGASQFSLNAGTPATQVDQFDIGLFANDDWKVRPNLTLSYGLRYEAQTNINYRSNWAPRAAIAWGIGGGANKSAKTILRAGFGIFYDRIPDSTILNTERYNGVTQQSYFLQNPDTYPSIPSTSVLNANKQPQQIQLLDRATQAPRNLQASFGLDRQINKYFKLSGQYVESRGTHLSRQLNVNTPVNGIYPYGDKSVRLLTETNGFSRSHQLFVSPSLNYKKIFLFGFYSLSAGRDDNEGQPDNPYNLRAEWGPSSFADVRHRGVIGTSLPGWKGFSLSPFLIATSGAPYNITTGRDPRMTGSASERPSLLAGKSQTQCTGADLIYEAGFGCFNLNPGPNDSVVGRNSARGPGNVTLNLRLAKSWAFGNRGESGNADGGMPPGMGGIRGGGGPPAGGPPGGGGPPPGLFGGGGGGKKYNLTFSISARNAINHPNYGTPSGDLSSPYFGQSRTLAGFGPFGGSSTYNRKIDLQLRFAF
jgi:hypothetical protein